MASIDILACQWSGTQIKHGVDVLAGEDLAIVDVGLDLVAEDLLGVSPPALVEVGGGDQLDAGNLEGSLGVDETDDAHADRGDPNAVVGAGRLGRLDRGLELVDVVGDRGGRRRSKRPRRRPRTSGTIGASRERDNTSEPSGDLRVDLRPPSRTTARVAYGLHSPQHTGRSGPTVASTLNSSYISSSLACPRPSTRWLFRAGTSAWPRFSLR